MYPAPQHSNPRHYYPTPHLNDLGRPYDEDPPEGGFLLPSHELSGGGILLPPNEANEREDYGNSVSAKDYFHRRKQHRNSYSTNQVYYNEPGEL